MTSNDTIEKQFNRHEAHCGSYCILKLMYILECGKYTDAIQWAQEGSSFTVINRDNFERSVLPDLFKDTLFDSFQRKLYRWNFGKDGCVVTKEENAPVEQKDDEQKDEKKEEDNEKERKEDISIAEGKSGAAEAAITAIPVKRPAPPTVPRRHGEVSFSHSQFRAGDWDLCRSIKCRKRILSKREMEKKQVRTEARNQKRKAKQEKIKALHQLRLKRTKKAGGIGNEKKASASHSLPPITGIPPSLPAPSTSTSPSLPPNTSTSCNQKKDEGCTSTLVYPTHPAAGNGIEVTSDKKHVTGFFPPHLPHYLSSAFDQNDASLSNQDFYQHMPEEVIPYHSAEAPGDRRDRRPGDRDVPPTEKIDGSNTVSSENTAIAANPPPSNTDDCLDSEQQQSPDDDTRMVISLTSDEPRSVSWSASSDASSSNANFSTTVVDAASHRTGSPASEGEVEQKTWLSPTTTDTKNASELKVETAQLAEIARLREENLLLFFSPWNHQSKP